LIIACGGDGTISEVANGILASGKDAELGILPSGTGGDFRRSVEISSNTREAANLLRTGKTRQIDIGKATYIDHSGTEATRYFLGVASCGLSTKVIERIKAGGPDWLPTNTPQWLGGRVSFGASLIQTAVRSAAAQVVVQLDDAREHHLSLVSLCIANARYFGGGMKIAPNARLTDGKFDVVTVGDISALKIITSAPRLYFGSHLSMSEVGHTLAKRVIAQPADRNHKIILEIDGELPGRLPAQFQIIPGALKVRCGG
jgi:YegS/Rv2252/BmrU family lipid kinase